MNRRDFIVSSPALVSALPLLSARAVKGRTAQVICTWNNPRAAEAAMAKYAGDGSALDMVEAGAKVPESDAGDTSVGYGGLPDQSGRVTLDACIMDHEMNCGAVCYVQGYAHPISIARAVMERTDHVMLAGAGAEAFAKKHAFARKRLITKNAKQALKEWKRNQVQGNNHDTIGVLGRDMNGRIAGACSTSGRAYKLPGRVGDSPIIGAGLYVDGAVGAAAATGMGEHIQTVLGSFVVVEMMRQGKSPDEACAMAVDRVISAFPDSPEQAAFVALSRDGVYGAHARLAGFTVCIAGDEGIEVYDANYTEANR